MKLTTSINLFLLLCSLSLALPSARCGADGSFPSIQRRHRRALPSEKIYGSPILLRQPVELSKRANGKEPADDKSSSSDSSSRSGTPEPSENAKGKQPQVDTSPPQSRPGSPPPGPDSPPRYNSPTPKWPEDPSAPLPGRGDVTMKGKNAQGWWGDDHTPGHMNHLDRYKQRYPDQQGPRPFGGNNRNDALNNIGSAPIDPATGLRMVKDEKGLNSLKKDKNDKTSVEFRDALESGPVGGVKQRPGTMIDTEAKITNKLRQANEKNGAKSATLHTNPGWRSQKPDQGRAHSTEPQLTPGNHPLKDPSQGPGRQLPKGPWAKGEPRNPKWPNPSESKAKPKPHIEPNNIRPSTPPGP